MQGKDAPLPQATNHIRGQGSRDEGCGLDQERAVREAKELYDAGEGRLGTDEAKFTEIIGTRSFAQLRATFEEYNKVCIIWVWSGVLLRWVCIIQEVN